MTRRHAVRSERIFGLDVMRASAILMVLFGHLPWILPTGFRVANVVLSLFGFLGVEIFFVLSGFLIGRILFSQFAQLHFDLTSVIGFLKRRWFRTLPNYFLILCANILIASAVIGYRIDGVWRYFFFLQNVTEVPVFFPESWSLTVEEFAYLILPIALLIGVFVARGATRAKLFLVIVLLVYAVFIGTKIWFYETRGTSNLTDWNLHLKSVLIYRVDAICTGVIAAWIALNKQELWHRTRWLAAFVGVCLGLLLLFGPSVLKIGLTQCHFFGDVAFLPMLSLAIAAMLPLLSAWKSQPYGIGKPISYISLISYSMYLLHYGIVLQLLHEFALPLLGWKSVAVLYFALTFVLSAMLYRFFEKPMMDLRDR